MFIKGNKTKQKNQSQFQFLVHAWLIMALLVQSCSGPKYPGPLTPERSLEKFHITNGFYIEIFATEPHVTDPVDVAFDEFGNAYAVEMPDYPYKPNKGEARSRIRYLEDTDKDGRIDFSVIFQDSLSEATSILPWKGGLIVCAAPEILYLKDTNGDHVADLKEVLFTGFFENNSEAQITNLKFNVDNWIYGSNFGNPGQVQFLRQPDAPKVSVQGTDFRFRLDRGLFEPAAGSTQFGQAIDNWGNRFSTQNTIHISQIVIPWRYLSRDTLNKAKAPVQNISDHDLEMFQLTPPPYWRAERTARRQKTYDEQNLDRVEYAEDHFTGCSGGTVYTGDLFPESYQGSVFTGDVAGNLIHRDVLVAGQGPLFIAKRDVSETHSEFLASTDPWFRPANLTVAPDGSLLVTDMYRQHIETPLSIPEDLKVDMDFYHGDELGRIYRIVPEGADSYKSIAKFPGEMESSELVQLLTHRHQWWRLTAQRLLVERQDTTILGLLSEMAMNSEQPLAILHALYTMKALGGLTEDLVSMALADDHAELRVRGLQLAESYPELLPQILKLANDDDVRVVFQTALSIGNFSGIDVRRALAHLLTKYEGDPWFQKAVFSAPEGSILASELN